MSRADERQAPRTDPNPGVFPTSGHGEPAASNARPTEAANRAAPPNDTLLSVPQPTREDLMLEARISSLEQRIESALERVERLEQRPQHDNARLGRHWLWLVFLAGLALGWQILARIR